MAVSRIKKISAASMAGSSASLTGIIYSNTNYRH